MTEVGDEKRVLCRACNRETTHEVQSVWIDSGGDPADILWSDETTVLECAGCQSITLSIEHWNSENADDQGSGFTQTELYPPRSDKFRKLSLRYPRMLPAQIGSLYFATYNAAVSGSPWLAMIGIGSIIEASCHQQGFDKGALQEKINQLLENQNINKSQAAVLHLVRNARNVAAHEFREPSNDQLVAIWDVLNNLIESTLIIPNMPNQIGEKREPQR